MEFQRGEKVWLVGHEVTFVGYRSAMAEPPARPSIGVALVRRSGEADASEVPVWLLARDRAESVSRANAIPLQLKNWDLD